jgi:ribonucleoside-diphosphate reductase alpha chain
MIRNMTGPTELFSQQTHADKYRGPNEDFGEAMSRIAGAVKDDEDHYHKFREALLEMRFLPPGRVQAAMGAAKRVTAFNCFVMGNIQDNFVGRDGIMQRATEAAQTMRMGGGVGYDFSRLRPRGDVISTLQSASSGPVSFMKIFDSVCHCTASSGNRRGAQMAVLRVDHPDIEEFIHCKRNTNELTGFNISVGVTDEFMEAVLRDDDFELVWGGRVYKTVRAKAIWEQIMRGTWDWAEPGVLFIDAINRMNNLYYCETIEATNPCGEQPLPPYGACLLGSFNLPKYVQIDRTGVPKFMFKYLKDDIPHVLRAIDNVIDRSEYPMDDQRDEAKSKRRIGIGVTGLANALEILGHPYGSEGFVSMQDKIMRLIRDDLYMSSALLAKEKGSFPLLDKKKYLAGSFIKTLPEPVRAAIRKHGIRNSHLTSIAPTGTISLCADNVSSGVEPVYSHSVQRVVQTLDGPITVDLTDYAVSEWDVKGKTTAEVTVDEHLAVLLKASELVDSAVSKTCNIGDDVSWDDFQEVYFRAWRGGAKGCTTFRAAGKRMGIMKATKPSEESSCEIDLATGRRNCE